MRQKPINSEKIIKNRPRNPFFIVQKVPDNPLLFCYELLGLYGTNIKEILVE